MYNIKVKMLHWRILQTCKQTTMNKMSKWYIVYTCRVSKKIAMRINSSLFYLDAIMKTHNTGAKHLLRYWSIFARSSTLLFAGTVNTRQKSRCIPITRSLLSFQTGPVEVQGHSLALKTVLKKRGVIIIKNIPEHRKRCIIRPSWIF